MACSLCVLVVALPLVVAIGALILNAAVGLANRVLPAAPAEHEYGYAVDDADLPPWRATAVPRPGFGKAAGIMTAVGLADLAAVLGLAVLGNHVAWPDQTGRRVVLGGAALGAAFLMQTGLLTLLLPTTFPRACLAAAFTLLLSIPVVLAVGGLAVVALNAIAPNIGR